MEVGSKESRQRWRVGRGGCCHLIKLKVSILIDSLIVWSYNLLFIWRSFPSLISQKPGKFQYLELNWNFQFWPTFHWKSVILSSAMNMTSLWRPTWDVGTYFGMYGKRSPLAILWYQLHAWGLIFKFTGGVVTTPLVMLVNCDEG